MASRKNNLEDVKVDPENDETDADFDLRDLASLKIDKLETKQKDEVVSNPNCHIIPKHPARVLFNGSSGSGKTNLIINMLLKPQMYCGYFNAIYLFSQSYSNDDIWQNLQLPENMVFENFSEAALQKLINLQNMMIDKYGFANSPKILFVFDDIIDDSTYYRSKALKTLFTRGRHLNSSVWFSTQEYVKTPPTLRKNMSDMIIFQPTNDQELERIVSENALGVKKSDFKRMLLIVTEPKYAFMVIKRGKNVDKNHRYLKNFDEYITPTTSLI